MKRCEAEGAMACVGAMIGAGFVSGREVTSFFSKYGEHSWWLILASALVMTLLCALCMRRASGRCGKSWCDLYPAGDPRRICAECCMALLLSVIGGAMVSASGHMVMLVWASDWAYAVGAVGTLCLAWLLGLRGVRPLSLLGWALIALFAASVFMTLNVDAAPPAVSASAPPSPAELVFALIRAAAYAAMNLAVAIGVVCGTGRSCYRSNDRQSVFFGLLMVMLLFTGNYLYLKHPELMNAAFPMVALYARMGRAGFLLSALLLYLAIFTTLIAILCALRGVAEPRVRSRGLSALLVLGVPLLVSSVGFSEIVDGLYAPIGIVCLLVVFLPLLFSPKRKVRQTENASSSS